MFTIFLDRIVLWMGGDGRIGSQPYIPVVPAQVSKPNPVAVEKPPEVEKISKTEKLPDSDIQQPQDGLTTESKTEPPPPLNAVQEAIIDGVKRKTANKGIPDATDMKGLDGVNQSLVGQLKGKQPQAQPDPKNLDLAMNPATSPEKLAELAQDKDPKVRLAVADNPNTPPKTLEQLLRNEWSKNIDDSDPEIRRAVARNPNIPPRLLETLATDRDQGVQRAVAENSKTPPKIKEQLEKQARLQEQDKQPSNPVTQPKMEIPKEADAVKSDKLTTITDKVVLATGVVENVGQVVSTTIAKKVTGDKSDGPPKVITTVGVNIDDEGKSKVQANVEVSNVGDKGINATFGFKTEDGSSEMNFAVSADKALKFPSLGGGLTVGGGLSGGAKMKTEDVTTFVSDTQFKRSKSVEVSVNLEGTVTVRGPQTGISISAGIDAGKKYTTVQQSNIDKDMKLSQVVKKDVVTKEQLIENPGKLKIGEKVTYTGMFNLGVKAGVAEANTGAKLSVESTITSDFALSIRRDPDGKFTVRTEPSNLAVDVNAGLSLGPFSVKGGGGGTKGIYYEFRMSESAVQQFLKNGIMPNIPDPNEYAKMGKPITKETFAVFDKMNEKYGDGVELLRMGTSSSVNIYAEGSGAIGSSKTTITGGKTMDMEKDKITHKETHNVDTKNVALWTGERHKSVDTSHEFKTSVGNDGKTVRTYEGVTNTFKVTDGTTSPKALETKIDNINALLNKQGDKKLQAPGQKEALGGTSLALEVKLTPAMLTKLVELDPARKENRFTIAMAAKHANIDETKLVALLADLQKFRPKDGGAFDISKLPLSEQQNIGQKVASFITGGNGPVTDFALKRICAMDRLLGKEVAQLTFGTAGYADTIKDLKVEQFIKSPVTDSWNRYKNNETKLQGLTECKALIEKNNLLGAEEKQQLLVDIKMKTRLLSEDMDELLQNGSRRQEIARSLAGSGGLLISKWSSAEATFRDKEVKDANIKRLIDACTPSELTGFARELIDKGDQGTGVHLQAIFDKIKDKQGQGAIDSLFGELTREKRLDKLMNRLTEAQIQQLAVLVSPERAEIKGAIKDAIVTHHAQMEKKDADFKKQLHALEATQVVKDPKTLDGYDLVDYYKPVVRANLDLGKLDQTVRNDPTLSDQRKDILIKRFGETQEVLLNRFASLDELGGQKRMDLFDALLHPRLMKLERTGETSHVLMERIMELSTPQERRLMVNVVATQSAGSEAPFLLKTLRNHPDEAPDLLAMMPHDKLSAFVKNLTKAEAQQVMEWAMKLSEKRDTLPLKDQLDKLNSDKDQAVEERSKIVGERGRVSGERKQAIEERDKAVAGLDELRKLPMNQSYKDEMEALEARITTLNSRVTTLDTELNSIRDTTKSLDDKIATLDKQIETTGINIGRGKEAATNAGKTVNTVRTAIEAIINR